MAAPSGYKTFAAGEVLDASAGVMAYLMDQVIGVYANSSARATAIGTAAEGQASYLKDTNAVEVYNGSSWVAVGSSFAWSGSTANGIGTYGSASSIVAESTATYDGTTLQLTTSGGGLKLDGLNSSDANTLDDYEEGTFTVAFTAGTGSITVDSSYNTCAYVKVGKLVHIQGQIGVSSVSSPSGALNMTGLPFTSANGLSQASDTVSNPGTIIALASDPSGGGSIYYRILNNSTSVNWRAEGGTTSEDSTIADLIDAGSWFWVGGTYRSNT